MIIPPGFGTVAPYLFIENAGGYIKFLVKAFDCEELGRTSRPDGKIANSMVRFGATTMMISESDDRYTPAKSAFYIFVEDADAAMARAIEAGATLEMKVADQPYGDRQGGVVDPAGNIWWVSQRLTDEPYY
ncbi:MAG: VOC family protein [Woeseia sp.]|nr:VOC family protein [Woeseia sp.]